MNSSRIDNPQRQARLFELMAAPVDPETFLYAVSVFDSVYTGRFPVTAFAHASLSPDAVAAIAHYSRTDQRFDSSMEAVARELQSMGTPNPAAYLTRVAMLPDLYGPCARIFQNFIEPYGDEGALAVQPALIRGAAVAKVFADADGAGFDISDVLHQANQFAGRVASVTLVQ